MLKTKEQLKPELQKQLDLDKASKGGRWGRGPGMPVKKPKKVGPTVRRLLGYLGVYKIALVFIILTSIVATLLNTTIPSLFSLAIDDFIIPGDYSGLYQIALVIMGFALFNGLVRFFSRYILIRISQGAIKKIREDAFDKLLKVPVSYFDEKGAGDLASRITNDVELINNTLAQTLTQFINTIIIIIGVSVLMVRLNWALALIVFGFLPLMFLVIIVISKKTRKYFMAQQIHVAGLNQIIEEDVSGLEAVKLYNQEQAFQDEFNDENIKLKNASFAAQIYSGLLWPFIHFFNNLVYLVVVAVGAILYISYPGFITIGGISGVSQYARQFVQPISEIGQLFNALMQGLAGAERIFELMDAESEYKDDQTIVLDKFEGALTFKNVSFGYKPDELILNNVSFTSKAGALIAIVGPTGGGKTTLIKLLNHFYDLSDGAILIDDINIANVQKDALRKRIGIVLQDTHLFKGSIFENIHYGDLTASSEAVIEAAQKAGAHEFITKLPDRYDTQILEGGQNFSQGERQLISIARTLLNNPDLLILDEATSNIDTRTEAKIQTSLKGLMEGRTSIVIAHRLQTIEKADQILVIDQGALIEQGTHQSLLAKKGFYYDLYQSQFTI
jgi:ATP-binding cassette, subfamily B, multidrug efflux pump